VAVATVHFRSEAIGTASSMNVILPHGVEFTGPFAVLYLLHGTSDDHTTWCRETGIERYVRELPLVVVMPDGGRAFYTDAYQGMAYERHITEDVIGFVERNLNVRTDRLGRAIGGWSMGGYGAMKLALKHPDVFGSVVAQAGIYDLRPLYDLASDIPPEGRAEAQRIFGPSPIGGRDDVFALAEGIDRAMLPAIRFDCGVEDQVIAHSRALHAHLERLSIPHEYREFPGAHTWAYWREHVQEAIQFHWRTLGEG
jgi:S-formylglutathione hydrolase FrmB